MADIETEKKLQGILNKGFRENEKKSSVIKKKRWSSVRVKPSMRKTNESYQNQTITTVEIPEKYLTEERKLRHRKSKNQNITQESFQKLNK